VSDTFHGRDIFAPVAAHLARGVAPARFGKLVTDYLRSNFHVPVRTGKRFWHGAVLKVDRFGNLITNFHISEFPVARTRPFAMAIGPCEITRVARTFAEAAAGEVVLVIGSSGYLEVAANQASAAKMLGCGTGTPVQLTLY
jgi:S-adenosylmethionine hydrolase